MGAPVFESELSVRYYDIYPTAIHRTAIHRTTIYRTTINRTTVSRTDSLSNRQFIEPTVYRTDGLSNRRFIEPTVHRTHSSSKGNLSNDSLSNRQFCERQFIATNDSLWNRQFIETAYLIQLSQDIVTACGYHAAMYSCSQGRNQLFILGGGNFHELSFDDVIVLIQPW